MFDLLDLIRKLLSQIIIGVRIIRWFGLMDELRYLQIISSLYLPPDNLITIYTSR